MSFISDKVENLPPYLFSELQKKKKTLEAKGIDVIDLGIGAPDLPAPNFVYDKLVEEAKKPVNHRYSTYSGSSEFKEAVASFYKRHYAVDLDPDTEVLTLIGSKEGIAHLIQAVINPGDAVILPDPGYPVYQTSVHLAGGKTVLLPLDAYNGYVPQWEKLANKDVQRARVLFLNYPSNPTAATIELSTFMKALSLAVEKQLLLVNDAAYDQITFDGYKAPSVMQVPGAKTQAVEFGSLSKSFNMTGWRIGYVVGNKNVIRALATLKSNLDTSQFLPIQKAAATALRSDFSTVTAMNKLYKERMEKMHAALREMGIYAERPRGTIFIWAKVPDGFYSIDFANKLLDEVGVMVTPGIAFGSLGEGYFRIALTVTIKRLDDVIYRLKKLDLGGEA
ncbi:aminotransferase class I/II-fold pyridoxal phosphate-dependent enzyme [Virgibacillus sp. NKC19-3]|uniref:aminotransferase class I/II-fold pyridoxal phosphate-dependent enzyme n=1 Tax=Virgibacillus saliphilus TaxID=2831674 RepID=UPI001C9B5772|nr:aminotransferase class I/II-fold pyridoxal phosphate-dependent enzyme [Virgibacillus sp. NKC19-3]MBY7142715.1 aminotransferase class I/II-fold pyridoxal phosphate-dependent enzyme [Virgibacillus sp. NKC19-3]